MAVASDQTGINIGETYKGLLVGLLLASILCGVATTQTVLFFGANKVDPLGHKIFVAFLWFLDVLQVCFVFHGTLFYTVDQIGNPSPPFVWSIKVQIFMQTIIMGVTKVMYIVRIWKLRHLSSKWVSVGLVIALSIDYAFGTFFAYEVFTVPLLHDLLGISFKWTIIVSMTLTSATDILIGFALVYTLAKSSTNLNWTNSSYTMLSAYLVNTGIITGVFSTMALIAFAIGVQNPVYIASEIVLPQLYVNCFLSMVNASYYFQTKNIRFQSCYPYFLPSETLDSTSTCILESSRRSLGYSSRARTFSDISLQESNSCTINEIGLPLFSPDTKSEPPKRKIPLEVRVQTTKEESSVDLRGLRYGGNQR